jgi:hypothetical protein
MFNWIKALFKKPEAEIHYVISLADYLPKEEKPVPKKRPRLYKQAVVVTKGELPKPVKKAPAKKVAVKKPVKKAK